MAADRDIFIATRQAGDEVGLGAQMDPTYLDEVWEAILRDPNLRELGHALLEFATKSMPGTEPEAIARFQAATLGAAFAIEVLRQSSPALR